VHCAIYTACVCAMVSWSPWWALVVFASHYPIDKWSFADKWMTAFRGRTLIGYIDSGHKGVYIQDPDEKENLITLRGGFACIVYCVVDNTFHLILMLLGAFYLKRYGLM
jgi:hypothetical protein